MSQTHPSSIRPLPDELAERIDRAADVFADNGLDATRIDELARVTGIPRATLYYYFPGKEHILAHLLGRTLTQMTVALDAVAAQPGTGREQLQRLVREHLRFIASHGSTYRLLIAELGKAAALVDIAAGVDRAILTPLRAALQQGVDDRSLSVDDVALAASVVYGAALVIGMEGLLFGTRDVDARADAVLELLVQGMQPKRKPANRRR